MRVNRKVKNVSTGTEDYSLCFYKSRFADDIVLIAGSVQNLQHNLNMQEEGMRKKDMTINATKPNTLVMLRLTR